jgi:iron complex outermembrane recepter protein
MAAKWLGYLGGTYTRNVNENYVASINARADFSSSYLTTPELAPLSEQGSYVLADLALRLAKSDGLWDLALLCRNCTDKIYIVNANSGANGDITADRRSTVNLNIARPRQILLQLTVHTPL